MSSRSRRERDRARSHPDAKAEADTADLATPMASDSPQSSQKEKGKEGSKAAASHAHNGKDDADGAGNEGEKPHDEVCEFIRNSLDPKLAPLRVEYEAVLQGTSKSCHRSPSPIRLDPLESSPRLDSARSSARFFARAALHQAHTRSSWRPVASSRWARTNASRRRSSCATTRSAAYKSSARPRKRRPTISSRCVSPTVAVGVVFCGLPAAPSVHSAPRSDTA